MTHPMTDRVARLHRMIADDRLLRGEWTNGRDRACLEPHRRPPTDRRRGRSRRRQLR